MRTCLLVLAALALGFAPAPLPRPDRGRAERNRMLGTWVLKQVRHAGATHWTGAGVGVGNGVIYVAEEVTISEREMRVLNPKNRREPQRIEIEVKAGPRHVDFVQSGDQRTRGLYRVEGATLTICYSLGTNKPRPTGFDDPNDIVLILERVRP